MDMFSEFTSRVRAAAAAALPALETPDDPRLGPVVAEPPRDPEHGDVATNAALVLAKPLKTKPRELATRIAMELESDPDVTAVEVAGPGFINLRLSDSYWSGQLAGVLAEDEAYGVSGEGAGRPVNVEYVSANPTGPMHVGHTRGAVLGDVLANLLQATGHRVAREYFINDAGAQIETLAQSAYLRYREALGEEIGAIPKGLYPGDYLKPVGQGLAEREGRRLLEMEEADWLPIVMEAAVEAMMALIRDDLDALGIRHDVFFSEHNLHQGQIERTIAELEDRGLVYRGRLEPPKGQRDDDWEDREQLLFRATRFGDDADRPLQKSDGSYTYFAADIAYHHDKFDRGFATMIDVLGADHGGYVKRLKAAVEATTGGAGHLEIKLCQIVRLMRGGEPVVMSKRSGEMVTLREVVDEVGRDATRFMMLFRKADAPLDFDFQKVMEQSKDNPVFYVQYAHARCASVLRQARAEMPGLEVETAGLRKADLSLLADEGEKTLVRRLADYPRIVVQSSRTGEPHRLAFYLHDLAAAFHAHWNRGKDAPHLRFIVTEKSALTESRLALVSAVAVVLRNGLALLGVGAPQEMR